MPDTTNIKITGAGLVGGTIVSVLLETLLEKKVLTLNEVRAVLERAMRLTTKHAGTPAGHEAMQIISIMMADRFSEHGHDK
jgi:hypothetical protein